MPFPKVTFVTETLLTFNSKTPRAHNLTSLPRHPTISSPSSRICQAEIITSDRLCFEISRGYDRHIRRILPVCSPPSLFPSTFRNFFLAPPFELNDQVSQHKVPKKKKGKKKKREESKGRRTWSQSTLVESGRRRRESVSWKKVGAFEGASWANHFCQRAQAGSGTQGRTPVRPIFLPKETGEGEGELVWKNKRAPGYVSAALFFETSRACYKVDAPCILIRFFCSVEYQSRGNQGGYGSRLSIESIERTNWILTRSVCRTVSLKRSFSRRRMALWSLLRQLALLSIERFYWSRFEDFSRSFLR